MILKLIHKNVRLYWKKIFLHVLLPMAVASMVFNLKYYSGGGVDGYVLQACMVICIACSIITFYEKSRNENLFYCSLPVNRKSIVISKYITVALISVAGVLIYLLNVAVAELVYDNSLVKLTDLFQFRILLFVIFLILLFNSIFLPVAMHLKEITSFIAVLVIMVISILIAVAIFKPFHHSTNILEPQNIILSLLLMVISLTISIKIFINNFNKIDL